ncbi:MAG: hypothetical protein WD078_07060 [Woeseia sp.]
MLSRRRRSWRGVRQQSTVATIKLDADFTDIGGSGTGMLELVTGDSDLCPRDDEQCQPDQLPPPVDARVNT